mmetsp:Transcript_113274/g.344611  ORF Transcript_113274/g.344611 Transcript_113274/m.344611 type:complete len:301 (-) Transcript_113274:114-1016(-)
MEASGPKPVPPKLRLPGPVRETLMQLFPDGWCLATVRALSREFCAAAALHGRTSSLPRWPLTLTIGGDDFVSKCRGDPAEFCILLDRTPHCTYWVRDCDGSLRQESCVVPAALASELVRMLGCMFRQHGQDAQLWACDARGPRRDALYPNETREQYLWRRRTSRMQCNPAAARQLLLLDACGQVVLRHNFLDPLAPSKTVARCSGSPTASQQDGNRHEGACRHQRLVSHLRKHCELRMGCSSPRQLSIYDPAWPPSEPIGQECGTLQKSVTDVSMAHRRKVASLPSQLMSLLLPLCGFAC